MTIYIISSPNIWKETGWNKRQTLYQNIFHIFKSKYRHTTVLRVLLWFMSCYFHHHVATRDFYLVNAFNRRPSDDRESGGQSAVRECKGVVQVWGVKGRRPEIRTADGTPVRAWWGGRRGWLWLEDNAIDVTIWYFFFEPYIRVKWF